jgi:hypothetical protein
MNQPNVDSKIIDLRAHRAARARARGAAAAKRYMLWYPGLGLVSHEQASTGQAALAHHFGYRQPFV